MRNSKTLFAAGAGHRALVAEVAKALNLPPPVAPAHVIENRGQAMPKGARLAIAGSRAERKAKIRAATNELVEIGQRTLVVSHLHPRWLRELVGEALTAGAALDEATVTTWRNGGLAYAHAELNKLKEARS